jgi:diacylglycerol kinase family enzyme
MFMGSRRLILNPTSSDGSHTEYVPRMVEARGFDVVETRDPGDGVTLAREAIEEGVAELAVCGGDGTVNEALRGVAAAGALDEVTFGVVPSGTANLLAENVGVRGIDHGLEVIDTGEKRVVDVGLAGGVPFLVSCIAGLPADASVAASSDQKERFGTLAFLVSGAQQALEFEGLNLELEAVGEGAPDNWEGEALTVLVGNARRFVGEGGPADMEDGLFDVAVVEQMPASNLVAEAVAHRILGQDTEGVEHFRASELELRAPDGEPITFSRDGELAEHESLSLRVEPRTLTLRVGEDYDPHPD